jgi:hypothetical protein
MEAGFQVTPMGRVWAKVTSPPPGTELHAQRYVSCPPVTGTLPFVVLVSEIDAAVSSLTTVRDSPVAVAARETVVAVSERRTPRTTDRLAASVRRNVGVFSFISFTSVEGIYSGLIISF